ncbi:MAG TPA: acylneuraminate cytidylyltransferase family protein [Sphingobium sp.]|nr:acylneuraminate cytidylyltransferase family protein [Sphingobium sp.]
MIEGLRVLAIVPARGGSKGVPRKNLRLVGGKPLVCWTIEAAQASSYLDRVVVSSDDDEICAAAAGYGAGIGLKRPAELAQDDSTSLSVVLHAVREIPGYDIGVVLQPTSPLRTVADIDGCLEMMMARGSDSCVSVREAEENPYWMYRLASDFRLAPVLDRGLVPTRRQDLPPVYMPNGAVYAFRIDALERHGNFIGEHTVGYVMPSGRSLDIDTESEMAEAASLLGDGQE